MARNDLIDEDIKLFYKFDDIRIIDAPKLKHSKHTKYGVKLLWIRLLFLKELTMKLFKSCFEFKIEWLDRQLTTGWN